MTTTALPDTAQLQALTELAVSHRDSRSDLAAEVAVPAVQLAQEVARQLHAYGLDGETLIARDPGAVDLPVRDRSEMYWRDVDKAEGRRRYTVVTATWRTGVFSRGSGLVMYRKTGACEYLLWNPRAPDRMWNLEDPPELYFREVHNHTILGRSYLADGPMLAQWAKDALDVMRRVAGREQARVQHLAEGVASGADALRTLGV